MARYKNSVIILFSDEKERLSVCLDSVLKQNDDSFQIILGCYGTDKYTREIAEKAEKDEYIVSLVTSPNNSKAEARTLAIAEATGKYITFVDPMDVLFPTFVSELSAEAELYKTDAVFSIVSCPTRSIGRNNDIVYRYLRGKKYTPKDFFTGNLHSGDHLHLMGVMFRRGFLAELHNLDVYDDEMIWMPCVLSYTKTYYYLPKALYIDGNKARGISKTGIQLAQYRIAMMNAIVAESNPELVKYVTFGAAKRLNIYRKNSESFPQLYAQAIHDLRENVAGTEFIQRDSYLRDDIERYLSDDFKIIPPLVYYADFGKTAHTPFNAACIDSWKKYYAIEGTELVCLNESNCDLEHIPKIKEAYKNGNYKLVNEYFLLETLCRTGGVAVSQGLVATAPLGKKLTFSLMLGWQDNDALFDKIFGCAAGDKYIAKIRTAFIARLEKGETEFVLKNSINDIILPLCNNIGGKGMIVNETIGIFSPLIFVTNLATDGNVSELVPEGLEDLYMQGYKVVTDVALRQSRKLIEVSYKKEIDRLRRYNKDFV